MTENHPITPPPELVQELYGMPQMRAIEAAFRAGADTELEACCEWIHNETYDDCATAFSGFIANLRAARRPEPPSLKEQALADFDWMVGRTLGRPEFDERSERIRRALKSIPDPS